MSCREVHAMAAKGFSRRAESYERARPGYPDAAVEWLAERLGLGEGKAVVDLAAGTPSHRGQPWREALERSNLFGAIEERDFDNPHQLDAEALGERVASTSFIAALPDGERERVMEAARGLAADGPVTLCQRTDVHILPAA